MDIGAADRCRRDAQESIERTNFGNMFLVEDDAPGLTKMATFILQRAPRAVRTLRSFSAEAIPRRSVTPPIRIASTTGQQLAKKMAASAD
jgi:hypothetical protein